MLLFSECAAYCMAELVKRAPAPPFTERELQREVREAFGLFNRTFGTSVQLPEMKYEASVDGISWQRNSTHEGRTIHCTPQSSEIGHEVAHIWASCAVEEAASKGKFLPVAFALNLVPPLSSEMYIEEGFADYLACLYAPDSREKILNKLPQDPTPDAIKKEAMRFLEAYPIPSDVKKEMLSREFGPEDAKRVVESANFITAIAKDLLSIHEKYGPAKALEVFLGMDEMTATRQSPLVWKAYLASHGIESCATKEDIPRYTPKE